ncbi:MAG TPA: H-NS histone family protein [Bryobacteraceae bacterium]|nr:H-NS histone family protein [Bryobacteraceae bacterium]
MRFDTLDGLNDDELRIVIARAQELLKLRDEERKAKAVNDARALLASVGLNWKDIAQGKGRAAKAPTYKAGHLYQHPGNETLVWNAKGQKPNWLRDLEGQGVKAVEITPGDNSRSRAADGAAISKSA